MVVPRLVAPALATKTALSRGRCPDLQLGLLVLAPTLSVTRYFPVGGLSLLIWEVGEVLGSFPHRAVKGLCKGQGSWDSSDGHSLGGGRVLTPNFLTYQT